MAQPDMNQPFLKFLESQGLEADQRLRQALQIASPTMALDGAATTSHLLDALCRLNTRGCAWIPSRAFQSAHVKRLYAIPRGVMRPSEEVVLSGSVGQYKIYDRAIELARSDAGRTFGASHFLRALAEHTARTPNYGNRARGADLLTFLLTGDFYGDPVEAPGLSRMVRALEGAEDGADDFQYVVALEGDRVVFRVASLLNDYVQEGDSGLLVPKRALLTHFGRIGLFTTEEVAELEDLINDPAAREAQFQSFFERHPHFLRKWDHRDVHPHVYLARNEQGPLIPDFILTNREAQDAAILDIKTTLGSHKKPLIRHQSNRVRFADAVQEACSQLRTYRRWFENPDNRRRLQAIVGMEVYHPRLMVVIGRSSEFRSDVERATLRADNPDVEVVTYDDILRHAQQRMVVIDPREDH